MTDPTSRESSTGMMEPAKDAAQSAKGTLQEKAHHAREQLQEATGRISSKVRETTNRARVEGEQLLRDQKSRVADRIGTYGSAVHRAAHELEDEHDAAIAFYTHRAADQLDRMSSYLREHDWTTLRRDAESFARRHQELFFGGLLLCGIALARFLKASQHEAEEGMPEGAEETGSAEGSEYEEELAARYEAPFEPTGAVPPQNQPQTPGAASGTYEPTGL